MKKRILIFLSFSFFVSNSQEIESVKLPNKLKETSGLEIFNEGFITVNDKGNKSIIYSFNKSGIITSEYNVKAKNEDWEALTLDDVGNLYIADTGNNTYSRSNLKIIIIKITPNHCSVVGTISLKIKKEEKVNIEAIAVVDNKLHLFNKSKCLTSIYEIPIYEGVYSLNNFKTQTLKTNLFITGADYDKKTDKMFLSGYNSKKNSSILVINDYSSSQVINSISLKKTLQIEGIKVLGNDIYFTNETYKSSKAKLNKINFKLLARTTKEKFNF